MNPERATVSAPETVGSCAIIDAVPVWLLFLFALLAYRGCVSFEQAGGTFNPRVYGPYASTNELQAYLIKSPEEERLLLGKKVYAESCAGCHQNNGLGVPGQFPPLAASEWVTAEGPTRIIRLVLNGIGGPIKVKGNDFNNQMPPWKDTLNDDKVAAVISYIRQNKEWGNAASGITPEQVAAIRKKVADKDGPWQPADLEKLNFNE
jgi:mono/diheme cytochrome c family protein